MTDPIRARLDTVWIGPNADAIYYATLHAVLELCDTNGDQAWTLVVRSSISYHLGVTDA